MKKIFTLLAVAAASISFASAQSRDYKSDRHDSRDYGYSQGNSTANNSGYFFTERERDAQISKINRDFDLRIAMIQRDRRLRTKQKTSQIKLLEKQRAQEIRLVQQRWSENLKKHNGYSKNNGRKW